MSNTFPLSRWAHSQPAPVLHKDGNPESSWRQTGQIISSSDNQRQVHSQTIKTQGDNGPSGPAVANTLHSQQTHWLVKRYFISPAAGFMIKSCEWLVFYCTLSPCCFFTEWISMSVAFTDGWGSNNCPGRIWSVQRDTLKWHLVGIKKQK